MLDAGYSIPETSTERRVSGIEGILELAVGSVRRRAKRLESAISICILAILFLIGVGVFVKQFNYDMSRFGIQHQFSLGSRLIGAGLAPAGFETVSKIEVYNSENLYEKINGKAPFYIESGFERLSTQRFVSRIDESLWMELFLFDMGTVRNAFSVYSRQVRPEASLIDFPFRFSRYRYMTGNALYFCESQYYVEVIGSAESDKLLKAITEVGRKLWVKLDVGGDVEIAGVGLFPEGGLVKGSIKLYLTGAFGFEGLTDTFTARYKFGDETITAFIIRCSDPHQAHLTAKRYYDFLISNGGNAKQTAIKTLEGKIVDFYGTTEIVFTVGPFVAGIHEAENRQAAENLAEILLNKLNEAAN